ncbi:MAG: DUF2202 domain-containing protein [Treponema sp.]|nr:DUF2202 domain-containing protein [Treponema sp.]
MEHISRIVLSAAVFLTVCTMGLFSENSPVPYGNKAAAQDTELNIEDMLLYSLEDEYMAHAEYTAILAEFGTVKPFDSILKAEETHIAAVKRACGTHDIAVPPDQGAAYAVVPSDLKEALKTGVQAELDNIAMYERFLSDDKLAGADTSDISRLFRSLKRASENHLQAFRKQLKKY